MSALSPFPTPMGEVVPFVRPWIRHLKVGERAVLSTYKQLEHRLTFKTSPASPVKLFTWTRRLTVQVGAIRCTCTTRHITLHRSAPCCTGCLLLCIPLPFSSLRCIFSLFWCVLLLSAMLMHSDVSFF